MERRRLLINDLELKSEANQILNRARKRVRRHGVTAVELQSGSGDPAQAIIEIVRRKKPDILVVQTRARSFVRCPPRQRLAETDDLGPVQCDGSSLDVALSYKATVQNA